MAISPPNYQRDAIPTISGWRHPRTNELLKAQNFNQAQIDEYMGVKPAAPASEPVVEEVVQLNEAPTTGKSIDEMNKLELEALGRQHGVELDRREKRSSLLGQVKDLLG